MKVITGTFQPLHLTVKSSRLCGLANTLHLHFPLLRRDFKSIRTSSQSQSLPFTDAKQ